MNKYSTHIAWSDEDEAFVATCPEVEGLSALGPTPSDAVSELEEALELALEAYEQEGWEPPRPNLIEHHSGQFRVRLPRSLHGALSRRAEVEGVSLNSLVICYLSRGVGRVMDG